jgi:hypothetical protein
VGKDREKVDYAFLIFDGIIQQVYKIEKWFPALKDKVPTIKYKKTRSVT